MNNADEPQVVECVGVVARNTLLGVFLAARSAVATVNMIMDFAPNMDDTDALINATDDVRVYEERFQVDSFVNGYPTDEVLEDLSGDALELSGYMYTTIDRCNTEIRVYMDAHHDVI